MIALTDTERRATYRDVFAVAEYRALWAGQGLSTAGDQVARVALSVLAYDRTHSALLAAVTFAASFAPALLGGMLLAGLADRIPRRALMIACDLLRAVLLLVMTVPGMPLAALIALLFAVTTISSPFNSARAAIYPEVLQGETYVLGTAVTLTTMQLAQVIGFALGGVLTGLAGPRPALLVDAATFAASALLLRLAVRRRPASQRQGGRAAPLADMAAGIRLVFRRADLRTPMLYAWLSAFYNAPEAIAAPFARQLHAGASGTGLLLAAGPAGYTVGAAVFGRYAGQQLRQKLMAPLAAGCSLFLLLIPLMLSLPFAMAILAASGACTCFQVAANSSFVAAAPPSQRGQAFGLATGGMSLGQGIGMVLAGLAAQRYAPATVIAATGVIGLIAAAAITVGAQRDGPAGQVTSLPQSRGA